MSQLNKTVLFDRHQALGGKIVEFGGWEMPVQYPGGILEEHLQTRKGAGIFDVSHMGRFIIGGSGALPFLQHVLTNNAAALEPGRAQYTMIPNAGGGAIDDAYLYRFDPHQYLLVVNASNRLKDWEHFQSVVGRFPQTTLVDVTFEMAMISLQGPRSKEILSALMEVAQPFQAVPAQVGKPVLPTTSLPEPRRNSLGTIRLAGVDVLVGRTGYTGEPLCFELFLPVGSAQRVWDLLMQRGATPVGLGARDTLRLEACLPLYGHELGLDPSGREIPIFACPLAKFAVSLSPLKGDFVGRAPIQRQYDAFKKITFGDYSAIADLPQMVMPIAITDNSIARAGAKVSFTDSVGGAAEVGYVTSGTMVPYWKVEGEGLASRPGDQKGMRAIGLALLRSDLVEGTALQVDIRGRKSPAAIVPCHLRGEAPPFAWPRLHTQGVAAKVVATAPGAAKPQSPAHVMRVTDLLRGAIDNTVWRQRECINLIPSEMTQSPMVRLLSVMDPSFRYAEHKTVKALRDAEIFYYQGTGFIEDVERLLEEQFRLYLGCTDVETRPVSGQMANMIVYSAIVDYLNRASRRDEARRISRVMNNGILRGGHLSAQPMGALKDYVARDPQSESPAVVNFPVRKDNPYKMNVDATRELIARYRPELIILGRSLVLYPEPVAEIRAAVDELKLDTLVMYDMAHVLGLVGPHFQEPFKEGADVVTGSTHKTFFGTQRGVVAASIGESLLRRELWDAIRRRTFPGSVSNHHLGTMLGLLMAAYEMNHFKDQYQPAVIANAKALAVALNRCGLQVAGDPADSFTQTHQVVVVVGYGKGPELARRLEDSNIIVNYQAGPETEGFSAAEAIRLGASEMTRWGMHEGDFGQLAQLIADVVLKGKKVAPEVKALRSRFTDLKYCFDGKEFEQHIQELHKLI